MERRSTLQHLVRARTPAPWRAVELRQLRLTVFSRLTYTRESAVRADAPPSSSNQRAGPVARRYQGRLAQLVRAPALQAGGRRFESCTAHHKHLIKALAAR